ncbi:hypothetical protein [Rhizobacter sp. Root404]|uniref:hypothetical protein n=1 Tax=Rhizobacter sp. Root404 TaxID=1736528 RepID=UPI0006FABCC7|nr:hypothetical protein [Rhizobacter sp. Root404]KQW36744.1 hypothetical protein ASC76_19095 [Rhizobacter sp. Root404]
MRHFLRELITDARTGKPSLSKVFSLCTYTIVLTCYAHASWVGPMSSELTLVVLGIVAGNGAASKFLSMKFNPPKETQ